MSHELRTPLNSIIGMSELALTMADDRSATLFRLILACLRGDPSAAYALSEQIVRAGDVKEKLPRTYGKNE